MNAGTPDLVERYRVSRRDSGVAVLEGFHALKHALRFGAEILDARTRDAAALRELAAELSPDVADAMVRHAIPLDAPRFDSLAPSPHPTGVIALARRPTLELNTLLRRTGPAPIMLLERPTHHGNIGAVIRVSAAAGAAGVLVTGSHDPWHPASIRGGAGLQFALPVDSLDPAGLDAVVRSDRPVVALDPQGEPIQAGGGQVPPRSVLVFGSERTGVSPALLNRSTRRVSIPMRPGVSSLNLATAAAVALYVTTASGAARE